MARLEVACFNANSAIVAANAGADRIELCANQPAGGTTPTRETVQAVKARVDVPVFVMIRPRGGDFCFSDEEFGRMKADVEVFRPMTDGFVFGVLDHSRRVDVDRTAELVRLAQPLPCTFHRAFDEVEDHLRALEDVIDSGCQAILSSGGAASALSGIDVLAELVRRSRGRIDIMPGGCVRAENIAELKSVTQATFYHSSGLFGGGDEPKVDEIRQMKTALLED